MLPSCSALLMFNQLRQVDVEGDDRDGDLPALKVGGQWRLRESQLISWIQSREGKSQS